ncbi:hypothetical protein [Aestuariispira ectoiniformans]|uniref:hypothetical protein n=1 Tax=Aestuariispira ectoiniformans TaxID=2775080 RepID=UPI00223AC5AD|nr:hypothetical protein [Aestuariispira ectoiniformans]
MRLFFRSALKLVPVLALPVVLSACEGVNWSKPAPATCPEVRVLEDLGKVTRYKPGPGRDITDVLLEAEFSRVAGDCNVSDDSIEVGLYVGMNASQGPAEQSDAAEVNMIMAIADADRHIISRRSMPIKFSFAGNNSKIYYQERFLAEIPRKKDDNPEDYSIYLGYELSRDELNFNRGNE